MILDQITKDPKVAYKACLNASRAHLWILKAVEKLHQDHGLREKKKRRGKDVHGWHWNI